MTSSFPAAWRSPTAAFFAEIRPYVVGTCSGAPQPPSLYERAGGSGAFERLFHRFYEKVVEDELLSPLFAGMSRFWIGEVFGGPTEYTAHHGGSVAGPASRRPGRANCRAIACR